MALILEEKTVTKLGVFPSQTGKTQKKAVLVKDSLLSIEKLR